MRRRYRIGIAITLRRVKCKLRVEAHIDRLSLMYEYSQKKLVLYSIIGVLEYGVEIVNYATSLISVRGYITEILVCGRTESGGIRRMKPLVYHSAGESAPLEHCLVLFVPAKSARFCKVDMSGYSVGLCNGCKFYKPSTCTSNFRLSVDYH